MKQKANRKADIFMISFPAITLDDVVAAKSELQCATRGKIPPTLPRLV
jgi:hypothetical protein